MAVQKPAAYQGFAAVLNLPLGSSAPGYHTAGTSACPSSPLQSGSLKKLRIAQQMLAAELPAFVVGMAMLPVQLCLAQPDAVHLLSPETEVPLLLPFWEDSQDFQMIYFHLGKATQQYSLVCLAAD